MCRASREWLCSVVLWSADVERERLMALEKELREHRKPGFMEQLADNIEKELLEHFRKENEKEVELMRKHNELQSGR